MSPFAITEYDFRPRFQAGPFFVTAWSSGMLDISKVTIQG